MAKVMSRCTLMRTLLTGSITASATGAAALLAKHYGLVPPDNGGLFGVGETLTYAAHRVLLRNQPLAREFRRDQISKNFPAINTVLPEDSEYKHQMGEEFKSWRLEIDGLVASPAMFSLEELKSFPSRTQIT